jgi:hypothetical protein
MHYNSPPLLALLALLALSSATLACVDFSANVNWGTNEEGTDGQPVALSSLTIKYDINRRYSMLVQLSTHR